jgi:hypothetical protein
MTIDATLIYQNYVYETDLPGTDGTFLTGLIRALANAKAFSYGGTTNDPATAGSIGLAGLIRGPGHKKREGITYRYVTVAKPFGDEPFQYRVYRTVPIFTQTLFLQILATLGTTQDISYEGETGWAVTGVSAERYGLFGTLFTVPSA